MEAKLNEMMLILRETNAATDRMDAHVTFVETVYDTVQRPFHAVMNAVDACTPSAGLLPLQALSIQPIQLAPGGVDVDVDEETTDSASCGQRSDPSVE